MYDSRGLTLAIDVVIKFPRGFRLLDDRAIKHFADLFVVKKIPFCVVYESRENHEI